MKKLLNISVIAALAVLPLAANAAPVAGEPAHADPATVASAVPGYALAESESNDGNLATAGYVKGAYNAAIKAVNKVATTAASAVKSVTTGATNGTIAVDGTDVAVHGLGTAAYTASTAYATAEQGTKADNADTHIGDMSGLTGTATTLVGAIEEVRTGAAAGATALQATDITTGTEQMANGTISVDGNAVAVKGLGTAAYTASTAYATAAQGAKADTALQSADIADYAKKTGVTQTITNSTISGTVPVVATWGSNTAGTVAITAGITGATYAEPVVQSGGEG